MSDIDWSKAPADATRYHPDTMFLSAHWWKKGHFCNVGFESEGWKSHLAELLDQSLYVDRPRLWNGEGLPAVGDTAEYFTDGKGEYWCTCRIQYVGTHFVMFTYNHPTEGAAEAAVNHFLLGPDLHSHLRPVRTAEQIAAEVRAQGITALGKDINGRLDFNFNIDELEGLYDGGYRALDITP